MAQLWTRPHYTPGPHAARVASLALFSGRVPETIGLDLGFPPPEDLPDSVRIEALHRGQHPALQDWLSDRSLRRAAQTLGTAAAKDLGTATGGVLLRIDRATPVDLSHIQLQWAFRAAAEALGARAHLDLISGAWLPKGPLPEDLDIGLEISTTFSHTADPQTGYPCYTQGLAKFGQPDLLCFASSPAEKRFFHALLRSIAQAGALGLPLSPGATFNDGHSARFRVQPVQERLTLSLPEPLVQLVRISMAPDA
ncbi:MAG: hypothetical protein EA397_13900 [Deltaproteobacteria bacterium]|nr:MAG: hypothetical protein EA397_13900 [Deltaproteobacteria bacterium]